jgi:hypothetical protein
LARVKKLYPALKHGGYSVLGLLPGEDRAAFEKLHREEREELRPDGPLEEDIVASIANSLWRKQNLGTFRRAEAARRRHSAITSAMVPQTKESCELEYLRDDWTPPDPAEVEAAREAAEVRAREELREDYPFIEMEELPTRAKMLEDLEVEQRLNAQITKLFKTLCMLKAFKSLASAKSPPSPELPRISGPKKAA